MEELQEEEVRSFLQPGHLFSLTSIKQPHRFMARSVARRQLLPLDKGMLFPSLPRMDLDLKKK